MSTERESTADRRPFLTTGKINSVLLIALLVLLMFQVGSDSSECAHAQSGICSAADDVDIAGNTILRGEIQVESTPTAGSAGEVMVSQGAAAVPIWDDYFIEVLKAADETVSASTTLQNDDDFSFSTVANAKYLVEFGFRLSENIAGAQDFKMNWTGPSGWIWCGFSLDSSGPIDNECGQNDILIDLPDGTESLAPVWGIVDIAATAGTMQMQWAQASASNNTTMHQYSTMRVKRIK